MTLQSPLLKLAQCCLLALTLPLIASAQDPLPWALRNHYSFPAGNAVIRYAEANAGWRVEFQNAGDSASAPIVDGIGFEVRLEDGTLLTGDSLEAATCERQNMTGAQGEATQYTVRFPEKAGLAVEHRLTRFGDRLFVVMDVSVRNVGTTPIRVAEISPVVLGAGSMGDLGADAEVCVRAIAERGGGIVVQKSGEGGGLTLFHMPSRQGVLALGLLPDGQARSRSDFRFLGSSWQGRITCSYAPYVSLEPGETLRSDRLWISHGTPEPHQVDLQYAWMFSTLARPLASPQEPIAWVSIEDSGGLDALVSAVRAWRSSGVKHALVPARWEGRPGSLNGAVPRYPRDMKYAADALRQAGCSPGITVDPLVAEDGDPEWAARAADGQIWLDLSHENARAAARAQIARLLGAGFDFVAVAQSMIPDAALTRFGLSRAQADRLAFQTVIEAAGTRPVYAVAEATLPFDREVWREAAAAASRLAYYQVAAGAVRVDAGNGARLDAEAAAAVRLWPGAIEVLGEGTSALRNALGAALSQGRLKEFPLDAARRSPAVWQRDSVVTALGSLRDAGGTTSDGLPGALDAPEPQIALRD